MSNRPTTLQEIFPNPPEGLEREALDLERVPSHIAVIMDGNGRWAEARGLSRGEGHKAGVKAVREAITTCNDIGVKYLDIYSFSTENWKRPETEVTGLMDLFAKVMGAEIDGLDEENVRVEFLGDLDALPLTTRTIFKAAARRTRGNTGMTLCIAVNYGSRQEIARAAQLCMEEGLEAFKKTGAAPVIDEERIAQHLYTAGMPDPDLVIRTSGELRVSNFLLWQIAYAEFYVTDLLWPDFDRYELLRALIAFQDRNRRFGKVS